LSNGGRQGTQPVGRFGVEVEHRGEPRRPPELDLQHRQLPAQLAEPSQHRISQTVLAQERDECGDVSRHSLRCRTVESLPPRRHQRLGGGDWHDDRTLASVEWHLAILPGATAAAPASSSAGEPARNHPQMRDPGLA
jgi:hypothetical protein